MKKNVDLTKLTDEELKENIKTLKNKSKAKEEYGKCASIVSVSVGALALMVSSVFLVPSLIVAGISVCGILTGWGLVASSIDNDKKIQNLTKELNSRIKTNEETKKISKVDKVNKTKNVIKRNTKNLENNENDLSL